jgi:hypothetical protein
LRRAIKFLTSPPPPLDPTMRYPVRVRYALLWVAVALFVEWYYFGVEVSYDSIPDKPLFWVGIVGWALPGIIIEWAYRNLPTKRLIKKYGNWMIGIGLVVIAVSAESQKGGFILPFAYAMIPGLIAGGAIGSDSLLVWTLIKNESNRSDKSDSARRGPESPSQGC